MRLYVAAVMGLLIAVSLGSSAHAEPGEHADDHRHGMPGGGWRSHDQRIEKMAERLELDDTQRQTVQNIIDAARPEMDALHKRMRVNRENARSVDSNDPDRAVLLNDIAVEKGQLVTEGALLFDRVHNDVSAVLTDEQREKFAELRERMLDRFDRHGRDHRRDGRSGRREGRHHHGDESVDDSNADQ